MRPDITRGATFPDYALPDHTGTMRTLSELQGSDPLILTLARGNYCPKEHQQHLELAANYPKVAVAYTQIATDDHHTLQEFRASVGAQWTFLSDPGRTVQQDLDIAEYTDEAHEVHQRVAGMHVLRVEQAGQRAGAVPGELCQQIGLMHVAVAVGRPGAFGERGGVPGDVRGELAGQGRVGGVAAEPVQVAFEQADLLKASTCGEMSTPWPVRNLSARASLTANRRLPAS